MMISLCFGSGPSRYRKILSTLLLLHFATHAGAQSGPADFLVDRVAIGGGGMITGVLAHPANPDIVYARSDTTGIYRWDKDNSTWINLADFFGIPAKNAKSSLGFAMDSAAGADVARQNMLYSTFGGYNNSTQADLSYNGVYRSADRGDTWTKIWTSPTIQVPGGTGITASFGNMSCRQRGERLVVDPFNPDVLWVATANNGLYRSDNVRAATPTFTKLANAPVGWINDAFSPKGITGVFVDPRAGSIGSGASLRAKRVLILVPSSPAAETTDTFAGGIWMTEDGGNNWSKLGDPGAPVEPMDICLGFSNTLLATENNNTSATSATLSLCSGGIRRYDLTANTWITLPDTANAGFRAVETDPNNRTKIVATSTDGKTIWLCDDNAAADSWKKRYWNNSRTGQTNFGVNYTNDPGWMLPGFQYPGGYDISLDATGVFWTSDPFGISRSADIWAGLIGDISMTWEVKGIENTVGFGLCAPPSGPYKLYAIMADVSGIRTTDITQIPAASHLIWDPTIEPNTSNQQGDATLSDVKYAPSDPSRMAIVRSRLGGTGSGGFHKIYLSSDTGTSWTRYDMPGSDTGGATASPSKVAFSCTDPTRIVAVGQGRRPKYATNAFSGSLTWNDSDGPVGYPDANPYYNAYQRVVADAMDGQRFFLINHVTSGTKSSNIWMSVNGGANWVLAYSFAPSANQQKMNFATMKNPATGKGELWVSIREKGLWRCTDTAASNATLSFSLVNSTFLTRVENLAFGKAFAAGGTPTLFVSAIANPGGVSRSGLYLSQDYGATFVQITPDHKPFVGGYDGTDQMVADPNEFGKVYANIGGGGVLYTRYLGFTAIQMWRNSKGLDTDGSGTSANDADPDADGLPNLIEYALDLDPKIPDSNGAIRAEMDASERLTFTFKRARPASDLTYTVEASSDLLTWDDLAVNPGTVGQNVTVTDTEPPHSGTGKRFLRLRATLPGS